MIRTRSTKRTIGRHAVAVATLTSLLCGGSASAQDGPETGWFSTAELSLLFTSGNSSARTFGLGGRLRHAWETSELQLRAGSLLTETGTTTRTAVGTTSDFVVSETTTEEVTAENYFINSRFDRSLSDRVFLYAGAGWERNTFAGFDNRFTFVGGLGNTWVENESTRFKTDYGFTFTAQDDVVDDP